MRRCLLRKRGPLSETSFPFDKSRLTLAGSNPGNTGDGGEAAKPQPVNAAVGHDYVEINVDVASPNELRLC